MRPRLSVLVLAFLLPLCPSAIRGQDPLLQASEKSEGSATLIAAANTAIPIAWGALRPRDEDIGDTWGDDFGGWFSLYGVVIGPFPGFIYAGDTQRGLAGVGIRFAGIAMAWTGAEENAVLVLGGFALCGLSIVWDFLALPSSVRRYNEGLSVEPLIGMDGSVGASFVLRW